jgi:pimeloyl-ACP methyl ester carboxylesterase
MPTLMVAGERDAVIPADHTRRAAELTPGSRVEIFEDSGHFPHLDEPERFAGLVADFVHHTKPFHFDRTEVRQKLIDGA